MAGVGHFGRLHALKYAALPGVRLVGVFDPDAARARRVAAETGARPFGSFGSLLGEVDLLSVASPASAHFALAREALEAGVHVLVEKPLAADPREAGELARLAERRGLLLQAGHLERFNPALQELRRLTSRPLFVEVHRLTPFQGRGIDQDVVMDLMIHDLDALLWVVGEEPEGVEALGVPVLSGSADIANARVRFPGGCVANLTASRISSKEMRKFRLFQPEAYLSADLGAQRLEVWRRDGGVIRPERPAIRPRDLLWEELVAFTEGVRGGQRGLWPPETLRGLELAQRVREALSEGWTGR